MWQLAWTSLQNMSVLAVNLIGTHYHEPNHLVNRDQSSFAIEYWVDTSEREKIVFSKHVDTIKLSRIDDYLASAFSYTFKSSDSLK